MADFYQHSGRTGALKPHAGGPAGQCHGRSFLVGLRRVAYQQQNLGALLRRIRVAD